MGGRPSKISKFSCVDKASTIPNYSSHLNSNEILLRHYNFFIIQNKNKQAKIYDTTLLKTDDCMVGNNELWAFGVVCIDFSTDDNQPIASCIPTNEINNKKYVRFTNQELKIYKKKIKNCDKNVLLDNIKLQIQFRHESLLTAIVKKSVQTQNSNKKNNKKNEYLDMLVSINSQQPKKPFLNWINNLATKLIIFDDITENLLEISDNRKNKRNFISNESQAVTRRMTMAV